MNLIKKILLSDYLEKNYPNFGAEYARATNLQRSDMIKNVFSKLSLEFVPNSPPTSLYRGNRRIEVIGLTIDGLSKITSIVIKNESSNLTTLSSSLHVKTKINRDDIIEKMEQLEKLEEINRFLIETESYEFDPKMFSTYCVLKKAGKNTNPILLAKEISEALTTQLEEVEI